MLTETLFSDPRIVNVDVLSNQASDMRHRIRALTLEDMMIHARPLNADDFWVLRAFFSEWLSLSIDDLLKKYGKDAELAILWLGTRRDTEKMLSKDKSDEVVASLTRDEVKALLDHITDIEFVSSEKRKSVPDLKKQLKHADIPTV